MISKLEHKIDRFLYPCAEEIPLDGNGLLMIDEELRKYTQLINLDEFAQLPGAILISEGGMGKTTLMDQLKQRFPDGSALMLRLGLYAGDSNGLRNDINDFINALPPNSNGVIIFDGLDEAYDLCGAVIRIIQSIPESISVWIASRDDIAIRGIQTEFPKLISYSLAPLSVTDILALCSDWGFDNELFLKKVQLLGITAICAKPIGCNLVLSVYKETDFAGLSQVEIWLKGITHLCDDTQSVTKQIQNRKFPLNQVVNCASWIATSLTLSNKAAIWIGEESHCPENCVTIADLVIDEFSSDCIRATIERGVFTPLGDGRIHFSHSMYYEYLAAYGVTQFIPTEHWNALLLSYDRKGIIPQRAGIAAWLAVNNKEFLKTLFKLQPEVIISSFDAVQAIDKIELCEALLNRSNFISYQQRHRHPIYNNLRLLKHEGISSIIRKRLLDPNSTESEIEFATEIAKSCSSEDLSDIFVGRVLNRTLPLSQRINAANAVYHLGDEASKARLKMLLPIEQLEDPQDELLGIVLSCCWPNSLAIYELVVYLSYPQKKNLTGSYSIFLEYIFPETFEISLNKNNSTILLDWAVSHITEDEPYDRIGRLARKIYSFCWKWVSSSEISTSLTKGFIAAALKHKLPFFTNIYNEKIDDRLIISKDKFIKDQTGRFTILEILLQSEVSEAFISRLPFNSYPLYTPDDASALFEKVLANPTGPLTSNWVLCIKSIFNYINLEQYLESINVLHELRPDLIPSTSKIMKDNETAIIHFNEMNNKWKLEQKDQEFKWQSDQNLVDLKIKSVFHKIDLEPNYFCFVANWLNSQNGVAWLPGPIDLRQSYRWSILSSEEQETLANLAERYIKFGSIPTTEPGHHIVSVAQAFTLLRILKPNVLEEINEEIWTKCSVELLKAAIDENMECMTPLFDILSKKYPEVAKRSLLKIIQQELGNGHVFILRYWDKRLSDDQAIAILEMVQEPSYNFEQNYLILNELVRYGKKKLVQSYLDSILNGKWNPHPDISLNKHILLAIELDSDAYLPLLFTNMKNDNTWGRQWIEMALMSWDNGLIKTILGCTTDIIAEIYIWLCSEYPVRPEHDDVFSPGPLDRIYELKSHIITYLVRNGIDGSALALDKIYSHFPDNSWLHDCILEAKANEQSKKAPSLSFSEIKSLLDKKKMNRYLIFSIQDLNDIIIRKLDEYQDRLQGDNPAISDLWNKDLRNPKFQIRPKDEEDLSDHLARFLEMALNTHVVINREVQIRRKQFKDGIPGSKTDVWIQAFDESGDVLTLCIEVKCNWNPSAKTAIKEQLIEKYMTGGSAQAGILLLGWYECQSWDTEDKRLNKSTSVWKDIDSARIDLEGQCNDMQNANNLVSSKTIYCGLK